MVESNLAALAAERHDTEAALKGELMRAALEISGSEILAVEEFSVALAEPNLYRALGDPPNDPNRRRLRLDITYLRGRT